MSKLLYWFFQSSRKRFLYDFGYFFQSSRKRSRYYFGTLRVEGNVLVTILVLSEFKEAFSLLFWCLQIWRKSSRYYFGAYSCDEFEGCDPVNRFNHTSWVAIVTPTDRRKSVRNRCVIEVFGGVIVLSRCFLDFSVGVGAFVIGLSHISSFFFQSSRKQSRIILVLSEIKKAFSLLFLVLSEFKEAS